MSSYAAGAVPPDGVRAEQAQTRSGHAHRSIDRSFIAAMMP
jgi:hypothetical protein